MLCIGSFECDLCSLMLCTGSLKCDSCSLKTSIGSLKRISCSLDGFYALSSECHALLDGCSTFSFFRKGPKKYIGTFVRRGTYDTIFSNTIFLQLIMM